MRTFEGFDQHSLEWLSIRSGVITASEIDSLISPKWEVRKGKGVETYVAQKAAEKWLGGPLPGYQTIDMELGNILESEALPWLSWEYGWTISRPAFIATDDMSCGCSPDGFCEGFGVEIKCPQPTNHVKYVLENKVPDDYIAQVQFGMFVTGLKQWKFVSYRRGFPNLVLDVRADPKALEAITEAVESFKPKLDSAMSRLIELHGAPPKKNAFRESLLNPTTAPTPKAESEPLDVPH